MSRPRFFHLDRRQIGFECTCFEATVDDPTQVFPGDVVDDSFHANDMVTQGRVQGSWLRVQQQKSDSIDGFFIGGNPLTISPALF